MLEEAHGGPIAIGITNPTASLVAQALTPTGTPVPGQLPAVVSQTNSARLEVRAQARLAQRCRDELTHANLRVGWHRCVPREQRAIRAVFNLWAAP